MVKVNRINTSQIEGAYSNGGDKRPNGEMALYNDDNGSFDLVIHDGTNSTNLNKVLGKGKLYGHGADSADGNGYDTIKLIPDIPAYNGGSDQYIIIDPTGPNHVHIRAGGTIDNSNSELIIGGENSYVKIGAGSNPQITVESNSNSWTFDTDGTLIVPGVVQNYNSFEIKAGNATNTVEFLGAVDNGYGDGPGSTLHVTSIISGAITDGMTIYGPGLPAEGWVLQFGTVMAPQGDGGTGNYYLPGANYLIGSQLFNNGDASNSTWTFGTNGNLTIPGNITLSNGTTVATGTFDNSTGGNSGISLNCVVGYELNWQGGHLKNTLNNGENTYNILCDSAMEFPGSGVDNVEINSSGLIFSDGTNQITAWTGYITSSQVSDFDSSISGLLPTISNSGDNRILTSTGNSTGINAESNLQFDGSVLSVGSTGLAVASVLNVYGSNDTSDASIELIDTSGNYDVKIYASLSDNECGILTSRPFYLNTGNNTFNLYSNNDITIDADNNSDVKIYASGLYLNDISVSISGHTHIASDITDLNSSVSGILSSGGYIKSDPTGIVGATAVNNIVQISQANFDNILSPDPNTIYIIND